MTHPLDEAIAEAKRMIKNSEWSTAMLLSARVRMGTTIDEMRTESAMALAKWTRIEKALVEAREKLVCQCGAERTTGYCSRHCDNDD